MYLQIVENWLLFYCSRKTKIETCNFIWVLKQKKIVIQNNKLLPGTFCNIIFICLQYRYLSPWISSELFSEWIELILFAEVSVSCERNKKLPLNISASTLEQTDDVGCQTRKRDLNWHPLEISHPCLAYVTQVEKDCAFCAFSSKEVSAPPRSMRFKKN